MCHSGKLRECAEPGKAPECKWARNLASQHFGGELNAAPVTPISHIRRKNGQDRESKEASYVSSVM